MNPRVKRKRKCNEGEQIMELTHHIHVGLIIFLIHYFDIMNSLKSDKIHYISIQ